MQYLLENGFAEPSISPWASPCIMIPKPDGSYRFCTNFRKVNKVTVPDSFPLPLVEDLIDRVSAAKYITTLDLCLGYWQITDKAKEISSFITHKVYSPTLYSVLDSVMQLVHFKG